MSSRIELYRRMAALTAPKCASSCRLPHSCCSPEYCEMAIEEARSEGVELPRTEHPRLPLMGPKGCTADPHHRPLCTLHLCSISGIGSDPEPGFDARYFDLRELIDEEESKRLA